MPASRAPDPAAPTDAASRTLAPVKVRRLAPAAACLPFPSPAGRRGARRVTLGKG